jgi:hypothetical protein
MIEDAPYMLEKMNDELKELQSPYLASQLVDAAFKLLFKRAPEM